jgi:uncharacterized surface protein with fasciclin (FAS1) repeats
MSILTNKIAICVLALSLSVNLCQGQTSAMDNSANSILGYLIHQSPEYSILVRAFNESDLKKTLETEGSTFTLFAPVNKAFEALPQEQIEDWLSPQLKPSLIKLLGYHLIAGKYDLATIEEKIKSSGGTFSIPTINGSDVLNFSIEGNNIIVKDARGNIAYIGLPVVTENGIIYSIDKILLH